MEQHAIPQQINSYEFKLVGEMTLKQFLKAAVGIVLALLVNASSLIFFLKYPLMIFFGAGGLMLAFVPYQDRPLEVWIMAFLKSIYSPTIYTYKKVGDKNWLELRNKKPVDEKTEEQKKEEEDLPKKNKQKVDEFINSLPSVKRETVAVDDTEKKIKILSDKKEVEKAETEKKEPSPAENSEGTNEKDWRDEETGLRLKTADKLGATGKAVFGTIPMPDKPEVPNIVVGMVTDADGKIIEEAIVEIQDEKGNPTRVLKTNSLGQFKTTTPLAKGRYLVIPEKDNYSFDRVNIDIQDKIVEPIKIEAKSGL